MMSSPFRFFTLLLGFAAWASLGQAATTTTKKSKSSSSASSGSKAKAKTGGTTSSSKTKSSGDAAAKTGSEGKDDDASAKPDTAAEKKAAAAVPKEDAPKSEPRPAAVSSVSIEEVEGFEKYPKQVQSLVQSALALTHLELRYLYGSHEPNQGGMDCSGTVYHVLRFQGLKDVPRQSDEMAMWVEKKSQIHLTPTATDFDSPEFADLKPGDLLFWTNTTATTRKLPVTHVMIYIGKLKGTGKRIIFGASDGRSFSGQRRSGVSVFDFNLPRATGTARLYGYGAAPGLMPQQPVVADKDKAAAPPEPAATTRKTTSSEVATPTVKNEQNKPAAGIAQTPPPGASTPPASTVKEAPQDEARKQAEMVTSALAKTEPAASSPEAGKAAAPTQSTAPAEEVRKAVAVNTESASGSDETSASGTPTPAKTEMSKQAAVEKKTSATKTKSSSTTNASTKSKSGSTTQKRSTPVSTKRRYVQPQKSSVERTLDNAVNSVRRIFR